MSAVIQMYLRIDQPRLSILTYDVEESVLSVFSRRTTLFCIVCCRCSKEKVETLPLSKVSRLFVHQFCSSQTVWIVLTDGSVLLPKAAYSEETLNQFVKLVNQKLSVDNPTQYQLGLQFYLKYVSGTKQQDLHLHDAASVNTEINTGLIEGEEKEEGDTEREGKGSLSSDFQILVRD